MLPVNGSDEILYFAFLAFGDEAKNPFAFPDVSYGFYPVYASLLQRAEAARYRWRAISAVDYRDYLGNLDASILLANPNAPTGTCLPLGGD